MKLFKNLNSEKGSITLFVLVAVLFFSAVLFNVYNSGTQKLNTLNKNISDIQNSYDNIDAEEVYQEELENLEEEETY